jgi:ligand-binding sensor domain-containing protein
MFSISSMDFHDSKKSDPGVLDPMKLIFLLLSLFLLTPALAQPKPIPDTPFRQEYREFHLEGLSKKALDVRSVAVDGKDRVFIATGDGVFRLDGSRKWVSLLPEDLNGPAYAVAVDSGGTGWIGAWNGLYRVVAERGVERVAGFDSPIT